MTARDSSHEREIAFVLGIPREPSDVTERTRYLDL
jgi:hypothetical protein